MDFSFLNLLESNGNRPQTSYTVRINRELKSAGLDAFNLFGADGGTMSDHVARPIGARIAFPCRASVPRAHGR